MKKNIPLFIALVFLLSCSDDRKEISITLVFNQSINGSKYPPYFKDITAPFTSKCNVDFLLKPISVMRLDISNKTVETNAWYFKDVAENTVDFSKGWLEQYFKDSTINSYLTLPSSKTNSIDDWILNNKDSLLIYSEESNNKSYQGHPVFNNAKELNQKIQEIACLNPLAKIFVLISTQNEPPPQVTTHNIPPPNNCDIKGLQDDINGIINTKSSMSDRQKKAEDILKKYFAKQFDVKLIVKDRNGNEMDAPTFEKQGNVCINDRFTTRDDIKRIDVVANSLNIGTDCKIASINLIEYKN